MTQYNTQEIIIKKLFNFEQYLFEAIVLFPIVITYKFIQEEMLHLYLFGNLKQINSFLHELNCFLLKLKYVKFVLIVFF